MENNGSKYRIVGGAAFAILAIVRLCSWSGGLSGHFYGEGALSYISRSLAYFVAAILTMAGYVIVTVNMFRNKKDKLMALGFGLTALGSLFSTMIKVGFEVGFVGHNTSFMLVLTNIVTLAAYAAAFLIALALFTDSIPEYRETARRLWFLPGVIFAVNIPLYILVELLTTLRFGFYGDYIGLAFFSFIPIIALMAAGAWMASPADAAQASSESGSRAAAVEPAPSGYCDMLKHILLLLLTFGIYYLVWIYRTTKYLNRYSAAPPRNPGAQVLLCMFVPFYQVYWTYTCAKAIDRMAAERGASSDISVVCLVLAFFAGVVPPMLMQDKINLIVGMNNSGAADSATYMSRPAPQPPAPQPPLPRQSAPRRSAADIADELKTYKELLDSGIITQEEFDAKKRQILELE